jgi:hypothetical protein
MPDRKVGHFFWLKFNVNKPLTPPAAWLGESEFCLVLERYYKTRQNPFRGTRRSATYLHRSCYENFNMKNLVMVLSFVYLIIISPKPLSHEQLHYHLKDIR